MNVLELRNLQELKTHHQHVHNQQELSVQNRLEQLLHVHELNLLKLSVTNVSETHQQEHNQPEVRQQEHNQPEVHPQEHNRPEVRLQEHNRPEARLQEHSQREVHQAGRLTTEDRVLRRAEVHLQEAAARQDRPVQVEVVQVQDQEEVANQAEDKPN